MKKVDKTSIHINQKSADFIKHYCLKHRGLVFWNDTHSKGDKEYPWVEIWDTRFRRYLGHVVCTWLGMR
jgi:hypothetical protein